MNSFKKGNIQSVAVVVNGEKEIMIECIPAPIWAVVSLQNSRAGRRNAKTDPAMKSK